MGEEGKGARRHGLRLNHNRKGRGGSVCEKG